jgi:8-oxo-dGTP pyrophosphatase MutT (NUDIX family)
MTIQSFNVGIKAAIVRDGTILALRSAAHGFWDLPGGRIDDEESIEQTLRREIGEEIGVGDDVELRDIVCAIRVPHFSHKDVGGLVLIAYEVVIPDDTEIAISDEHTEFQWLSFEQAQQDGSDLLREAVKCLS